ncbi:MAG: methylthioribulose 1-phosphate dehydratase [Xanthomonadaceae bacterium]|nr:methylthioribulose 1-phosphate dehydratase [Xanthomonadaceae bacterium]
MSPGLPFPQAAAALVEIGRDAYGRGWLPATSGNLSCRIDADSLAITVSGRHKGQLSVADIMRVDLEGRALDPQRPSAETLLHTQLYRHFPELGAVLHTHSVNATVLSRMVGEALPLNDLELLKAFQGIDTHETRVSLPVFGNDQDMVRLAGRVEAYLASTPALPGYLIAGHGLYSWGGSVEDAARHLEAFEFLFECELAMKRVSAP